jgi:hypothetical protein
MAIRSFSQGKFPEVALAQDQLKLRVGENSHMSDSTGQHTPFKSKKVAIIVENKFIPEEVSAHQTKFPEFGARVELISRIW